MKTIKQIILRIKGTEVERVFNLNVDQQLKFSTELDDYGTSGFKNYLRRKFRRELMKGGAIQKNDLPFWSIEVELIFY